MIFFSFLLVILLIVLLVFLGFKDMEDFVTPLNKMIFPSNFPLEMDFCDFSSIENVVIIKFTILILRENSLTINATI